MAGKKPFQQADRALMRLGESTMATLHDLYATGDFPISRGEAARQTRDAQIAQEDGRRVPLVDVFGWVHDEHFADFASLVAAIEGALNDKESGAERVVADPTAVRHPQG